MSYRGTLNTVEVQRVKSTREGLVVVARDHHLSYPKQTFWLAQLTHQIIFLSQYERTDTNAEFRTHMRTCANPQPDLDCMAFQVQFASIINRIVFPLMLNHNKHLRCHSLFLVIPTDAMRTQ
jgi:hypothetical protein